MLCVGFSPVDGLTSLLSGHHEGMGVSCLWFT